MKDKISEQPPKTSDLITSYEFRMQEIMFYIGKLSDILSESTVNTSLVHALSSARIYGGATSYVQHGSEYHDIDIKITSMDYTSFVAELKRIPAIMKYLVKESNTARTLWIYDREVQIIRLEGGFDLLHCESYIDIQTASIQGSLAALEALRTKRIEVQVDQVRNVFDTIHRVQKYTKRGYNYDEDNICALLNKIQFNEYGISSIMLQFGEFTGKS